MNTNFPNSPLEIKGHTSWLSVVKCYLKCQKVMNTKLAKLDLTTAQHELLMHINLKPGISQQQVSDRLLVVKSNTSALLKKLEFRELIKRRKDQQDARVQHLHLTKAGKQKLKLSMSVQAEVVQAMTAVMTDEEIKNNLVVMNRVYDSLSQLD
jgi:DNA-binding MarR family transcriptional regulator